jgi:hypothetical protein
MKRGRPQSSKTRLSKSTNSDSSSESSPKTARIGRIEEAPDYIWLNPFITRGYRLNHTFYDAVKSLFTIHNESINIWSHFLGAIFFMCCIFYLVATMHPPSLRQDISHLERWHVLKQTGKFDTTNFCIEEQYFRQEVCELENDKILQDLLEVDLLEKDLKRPSRLFYHLDHHHEAFERLECFLRNVIQVFADPKKHLKSCASCVNNLVRDLPSFVESHVR